ncbi:uncharacterized protein LOC124897793 [Capsicum annuum]|uniref:uncharacterized protein LOC124897793 n=1 Tax=Capsicum annuum TaxID=4072 RepID=UPI001FB0F43C|nr:uncharacterized protein LOC124897793 [Capsicum annuum]
MGILVDEELREQVVGVKRVSDRIIMIKLVIRGFSLHMYCVCAPQMGLAEEEKVRVLPGAFDYVHGGFGFGDRTDQGTALLDFARAFGLVVVNLSFPKKEDHLITFRSVIAKTQIDFLVLKKGDRALCKDSKVTEWASFNPAQASGDGLDYQEGQEEEGRRGSA